MIWFQRLFPVVMLLWPALATGVLVPRGETTRGQAQRARRMRGLWLGTLGFLALHVAIQWWLEDARPLRSQLRIAYPVLMAVLGSSVLWFGLGIRALLELREDVRGTAVAGEGPVRTASLVARHRNDPVPVSAWIVGWIVFAGCLAALLWAMRNGAPAGLAAGTAFWLFSGPLAARLSLGEPEPLDVRGSLELIDAYDSLRRFKSWVFFWMGLGGTVVFASVAVVVALRPQAGGILGAVFGVALGIGGAVLGVIGGARRTRIIRLRQSLALAADPNKP